MIRNTPVLVRRLAALAVLATPLAAASGQDTQPDDPMAPFARLMPGGWTVTFQSGECQHDIWTWGPARRSVHWQTYGTGGGGEPWRALTVAYWHPGHREIRVLGVSPFARGVSEGTMTFAGDRAEALLDMHQVGFGHRKLGQSWTFDDADTFRASLWEVGHPPLGTWTYERSRTLTAPRPGADERAPGVPRLSKLPPVLDRLLEHAWGAGDRRTVAEWIPYADGLRVRTTAPGADGEPVPVLDAFFYHHTGLDRLRVLTLSSAGGVYEGDVTVKGNDAVQLDLTGYEGDRVIESTVLLEFEGDEAVRQREWWGDDDDRTLVLDVRHEKIARPRAQ